MRGDALVAGDLAEVLPPSLWASFDPTFIRSTVLYDEFVHRLVLQVFEAAGLDRVLRVAGTVDEIIGRAGLEPGRARSRSTGSCGYLTDRGVLEAGPDTGPARWFRAPGLAAPLDPAPVRDEQARLAPTWLPSYVLAETVAGDYPAFLRGEASGEAILFSPARFRLWLDYFSNDNGLYAVNNRVGAVAVAEWLAQGGADPSWSWAAGSRVARRRSSPSWRRPAGSASFASTASRRSCRPSSGRGADRCAPGIPARPASASDRST